MLSVTRTGGWSSALLLSTDLRYVFDHVFKMAASQEEVYENTAKPLLEGVLKGFNATVFAYGVSFAKEFRANVRPPDVEKRTRSLATRPTPVSSFGLCATCST